MDCRTANQVGGTTIWQHATNNMQHATNNMQHATAIRQQATCNKQYATCRAGALLRHRAVLVRHFCALADHNDLAAEPSGAHQPAKPKPDNLYLGRIGVGCSAHARARWPAHAKPELCAYKSERPTAGCARARFARTNRSRPWCRHHRRGSPRRGRARRHDESPSMALSMLPAAALLAGEAVALQPPFPVAQAALFSPRRVAFSCIRSRADVYMHR